MYCCFVVQRTLTPTVRTERFVWWAEPQSTQVVWRCVSTGDGGRCVTTGGTRSMLWWCATNWDWIIVVRTSMHFFGERSKQFHVSRISRVFRIVYSWYVYFLFCTCICNRLRPLQLFCNQIRSLKLHCILVPSTVVIYGDGHLASQTYKDMKRSVL